MIGKVPPGKAEDILRPSDTDKDGNKTKPSVKWGMALLFFIPGTVFLLDLFIGHIDSAMEERIAILGVLIVMLFMDIYFLCEFLKIRVFFPSGFRSAVKKYGRERLIAQITDDNAEAFFVESDIYDALLILTDDYLICANEYIFALEDIRKISFSKYHVDSKKTREVMDIYQKKILQNVYKAGFTMKNGRRLTRFFALSKYDRKILIEALRRRCPEGEFSCPDIDGTDRGDDR